MPKRVVKIEAMMPLITEQLLEGKKPIIPIKGTSMRPFYLSNLTHVELSPPKHLKKHDAILFLSDNGNYILHRLIKIRNDVCITRGDALKKKETVKKENIVAKVTRHQHNKAWIDEKAPSFRFKLILWQCLLPLRRPLLRLERRLRRQYYDKRT